MNIEERIHVKINKIKKWYNKRFTVNYPQLSYLSDKIFIEKLYEKRLGKKPDLKHPKTFTEKCNWLKLYNRKPEYTIMVDKLAVREYIKDKLGENYLVPLIGVWDNANDIDFDSLPEKFVLKCNHASSVVVCTEKKSFDIENAKKHLSDELATDYYKQKREWPYKNVKRKIICEQFMENTNGDELVDYKFFCFNGEPKLVMLNSNRFGEDGLKTDIYDINWSHMDMSVGHYPQVGDVFNKPKQFDEMVQASKLLSKDIPFVRVDFNVWNQKMYFGELTFFDAAGYEEYHPSEYDRIMGDWLNLPPKKCLIQRKK